MDDQRLKIVIVDDNQDRRNTIKSLLPDYAEGFICDFGNQAMAAIRPDTKGRVPALVILNADDAKGMALYTFDWMINKEPSLSGEYVPVLLLAEDQFSDRILDFLEIEDAFIYEGDIEEDTFYSAFIEALDSSPAIKEEPLYSGEKSGRSIIGKSILAPTGDGEHPVRSAVLNLNDRMGNLEAALARGRKKNEEIRILLSEAQDLKERKKTETESKRTAPSFLGKAKEKLKKDEPKPVRIFESGPSSDIIKSHSADRSGQVNVLPTQNEAHQTDYNSILIKTVVVVDDDPRLQKLIKLFLQDNYTVISLDSGMKAIDYFIKNSADIILIDAVMPNLSGMQTLNSIRWQNNGKNVPALFLVGNDFAGRAEELTGDHVYGTIKKPFTKGSVITAFEQVKYYMSRK